MKNYIEDLKQYIQNEIKVIESLDLQSINNVMNILENTRLNHGTIYICGNGGSGATASHFVCDFNKGVNSYLTENKYHFICLNDNIPTVLAFANDISYDEIFSGQLKGIITDKDVVIGISGSGNSKNIINAFEVANNAGAKTIALCGYNGGKMKEICSDYIHVNSNNMQFCEDIHMMLDHMMMLTLCTWLKK